MLLTVRVCDPLAAHFHRTQVLTRQRTLFERTRKFLKDKWKTDIKRMLDAENSLIKTKSAYYQRCQTGVKLREELASAQNLLNELNASTGANPPMPTAVGSAGSTINSPTLPQANSGSAVVAGAGGGGSSVGSTASLTQDIPELAADAGSSSTTSNQVAKQRAKVERLEKQLSDNDKKEIEQMYAYREAVDLANHRLCDLEKSKMEILCDTRLTILRSDEVVKDSLAEFFNHLYNTRVTMVKQYETMAVAFQDYAPCSEYRALVEEHIQKGTDYVVEKYQFAGFHEATASGLKPDVFPSRFLGRISSPREGADADPLACVHSDSESEGEIAETSPNSTSARSSGIVSTSTSVLSSLVEFGSNLFRPDSKKSIRGKRGLSSMGGGQGALSGSATTESLDNLTAQLANLEKEYTAACYPIARCIAAIEKQPGGLETHGIYRVPASKAKVASLLEVIQSSQPSTPGEVADDIAVLSQEHPLTLAGLIKTRLITLPEPLLTYNLYPSFVELGKICDSGDPTMFKELVKRIQILIGHLGIGNRQLAGLLFHHLNRVAAHQAENQMNTANLGTMFAPTVLRQKPKFQVANMMEFMDNKGQTKVVEILIDNVVEIFGPADQYDPIKVLTTPLAEETDDSEIRRNSGPTPRRSTPGILEETSKPTLISSQTKPNESQLATPNANLHPNSGLSSATGSGQHGLLRSATITASSGRAPALFGTPLPLYTPYRDTRSPLVVNAHEAKHISTDSVTASTQSTASCALAEKHPDNTRLSSQPIQSAGTNLSAAVNKESSKSRTEPHSAVVGSSSMTPSSGSSSESPSLMKNLRKLAAVATAPAVGGAGSKSSFGIGSWQYNRSPTSQQNTTLSSLVIGRKRSEPKSHGENSTAHTGPEGENRTNPLESSDYTYIDTDP
ncbi:unnamed protein product [Calicophoron daubneyi]|uniref:Rho-GAP domain-containing protein n=1 Tax=Calicophoron daubneyi TaxID=300641 RepID=A0AAV2T8M9_CALDB